MVGLLGAFAPPAPAYHALDFHWGLSKMKVRVLIGGQWPGAAREAVGYWNQGAGPALSVTTTNGACDYPAKGIIAICMAQNHSQTHVHVPVRDDNHIIKAWIHVAPVDTREGRTRMVGIVCQEIGHALGLDHQGSGSSCMATAWNPSPDSHDYSELNSIYDHPFVYRHWHKGRYHVHKTQHCHFWLVVCMSTHTHRKKHWHNGYWHRHRA